MGPLADFIVSLHDGKVVKQGELKDVLDDDIELFKEFEKEKDVLKKSEEEIDEQAERHTEEKSSTSGKLIVAEEIQLGRVSRESGEMVVLVAFRGLTIRVT
jgi:ABC-type glutathione transport system ATPase component